ncbi:hypothetical protein, partial [Streptomyces sp. NRRL F-3307]|uniref:hypothetical protein n=1 Tax=Streptomyces sp. NRRL F-3307 TaxID=1463849 RepID=UPI001F34721D
GQTPTLRIPHTPGIPRRSPTVSPYDNPPSRSVTEFGVEVSTRETDFGFAGGVYVRGDGSMLFVRPVGRPEAEWEMVARSMLGRALMVPLPDLPDPYELSEL